MEPGIKLTATFESFDEALLNECKNIIIGILDDPWVGHHDLKESLKDVDSFLRVVDWYSRPDEYKTFLNEIEPSYKELVLNARVQAFKWVLEANDKEGLVPGWEYYEEDYKPWGGV